MWPWSALGPSKWRPGAQNVLTVRQNDSQELQDEAQERQDGLSECPNSCPDGPWQPNFLHKVLPEANSNVSGSLWDSFWKPRDFYLGGSNINFAKKSEAQARGFLQI